MIQPEYGTFEQAKKLKKKGFDLPCVYAWTKTPKHLLEERGEFCLRTDGNPFGSYFSGKNWNQYDNGTIIYSAPEHSQVIEWLRIEHGIFIGIELVDNTRHFYYEFIIWTMKDRDYSNEDCIDAAKWITGDSKEMRGDTPQEATSKAIDYVLDKLI